MNNPKELINLHIKKLARDVANTGRRWVPMYVTDTRSKVVGGYHTHEDIANNLRGIFYEEFPGWDSNPLIAGIYLKSILGIKVK